MPRTRPDCGYGLFCLFLPARDFFVTLAGLSRLSSAESADEDPVLKAASFLTQLEKGRLRLVRSWAAVASAQRQHMSHRQSTSLYFLMVWKGLIVLPLQAGVLEVMAIAGCAC